MLESILKGPLSSMLKEKTGMSGEQSEKAAGVSADSIGHDLQDEAAKGNFSQIQQLFSGDGSGNPLAGKMSSNLVSNLMTKTGLDQGMASKISGMAIPFAMNLLSSKTGGKADAGSLAGLFGGDLKQKLGGLGGLFK